MRKTLVLSAVGAVLALGIGGVVATEPNSLQEFQGLVQKVQSGGDEAPGARGQDSGGKSTAPGSREGGGGPGAGTGKGGDKGAGPEKGAGAEKGMSPEKADRGSKMRSGEKGARGGRTDADVDIRGDRGRVDRRTRLEIEGARGGRAAGRDVDVDD